MNMLKYKDIIEEGDLVIIYLSVRNMYPITLRRGSVFQNKYGALKHDDVIGKKYGSVVNCSRGYVYALFPTPELWTVTLSHRTQILYTTDISMIVLQLDLKPGSVVCEAGTGSGSMSHALARAISPNGFLHTFDFHLLRVETAIEEFKAHGLNEIVKVEHRDVGQKGFGIDHVADAVFLDLPQPWDVIPFVEAAMKLEGGRISSFSPCIEQVQRTCDALQKHGYIDIITLECLQRQFEVKKILLPTLKNQTCASYKDSTSGDKVSKKSETQQSKPSDTQQSPSCSKANKDAPSFWTAAAPLQAPGHTGYLTFATLVHIRNRQKCTTV